MSARVSALLLAIGLAVGMGSATTALAAEKGKVSEKVGKPLSAALDAAKNKQFDNALAKAKEADAIGGKTPFEQFKVNETLAYIYSAQKKYADAAAVYEKMLAAPQFLTPDQVQTYPKTIVQFYANANQPAKVLEYGKRYLQEKPNDAEMMALLGSTYYSNKDYKNCEQMVGNAVSTVEKAGSKPQEAWLEFLRNCSNSAGDDNTEMQAYEKLARYYPKPQYWQPYLDRLSRGKQSDSAEFNWGRLKSETGALKTADDYMNFATEAIAHYGVPGEAVRVLEEGFNKKVLGVDKTSVARQQNALAKAKEAVQADKAKIPQLTADAEKDATGQTSVDLGMIYFGNGQYDQAVSFLEKGIKKGNIKEPKNAKLTLGVAQLRKGERDAARATFKSLTSDPDVGKIASAWILRSYNS